MKKVYTHENHMIVFNMKNVLQGEGIETVVINEFADAPGTGNYVYEYVELYYSPEPATVLLLAMGGLALPRLKRRRR